MFQVQATCPTRVDLAGGTLDLWPLYHQLKEKATINLAINLNAKVTITSQSLDYFCFESTDQNISLTGNFEELCENPKLPLFSLFLKNLWAKELPPIKVTATAKSPKGAGIGGSSALSIAFSSAFMKARETLGLESFQSEEYLANYCADLESSLIKSPTGCQDYWGALRGGLNIISYPYGKPKIETFSSKETEELCDSLILVFSGQSRDSAINNWSVYQSFFSGDKKTIKYLEAIGSLAAKCAEKIRKKDIKAALDLSKEEWKLRKKLWPGIVTEKTESIDKMAIKKGAYFTRVCGAGGGGVMAIFVNPIQKNMLSEYLKNQGIEVLAITAATNGLKCSALI